MNRRLFLGATLATGAVCIAPARAQQTWIPGHVENNDPIWTTLNRAQVAIDEARGTMNAQLTDAIRALDGQTITVGGFVMPLSSRQRFSHFVLTRRNSSCPFCPANLPTEAVEVFTSDLVEYKPNEFFITGRFQAVAQSSEGLFYRLSGATARIVPV